MPMYMQTHMTSKTINTKLDLEVDLDSARVVDFSGYVSLLWQAKN